MRPQKLGYRFYNTDKANQVIMFNFLVNIDFLHSPKDETPLQSILKALKSFVKDTNAMGPIIRYRPIACDNAQHSETGVYNIAYNLFNKNGNNKINTFVIANECKPPEDDVDNAYITNTLGVENNTHFFEDRINDAISKKVPTCYILDPKKNKNVNDLFGWPLMYNNLDFLETNTTNRNFSVNKFSDNYGIDFKTDPSNQFCNLECDTKCLFDDTIIQQNNKQAMQHSIGNKTGSVYANYNKNFPEVSEANKICITNLNNNTDSFNDYKYKICLDNTEVSAGARKPDPYSAIVNRFEAVRVNLYD